MASLLRPPLALLSVVVYSDCKLLGGQHGWLLASLLGLAPRRHLMGNWSWTSCTLPMPRSSSPCSSLLLQQPHLGGEGELGVAEGSGQGHGGSSGTAVGRVRSLEGGPAPAKGCVLEEEERSAFLSCESPGALGLVLGQTDSSLLNHRFLGPIAGGPESTGICRAWESSF